MIAPEYFNNHIAVEGEIVVKRVPNDTGSVVVWNSVTNKLSIRTHAEIVSDLKILTTHTEQNVEGTKWFRTAGGSAYLNHRLRIISEDGSNPGMVFYKSGANAGTLQYDGSHYIFTNSDTDGYGLVLSDGYKKSGSNDSHVLLGGGGHKAVSDFASSADLPNLVTKNTEQTITADKVFKKITTTDWVIPKSLAFPDASGSIPNYIGFYMWNSQWQVNWRDSSNTHAYPLLDIDGLSKNATFYGNTTSPKLTTPGGNSDQWNEAYHSIGNYVTLNTDQGITGKKIFYNQGQNFGELPLVVWGNNGSKGGIGFVKGGTDSAILNFDTEFHFTNNNNDGYKFINAAGVKVAGSDDNHVLLGGGGHKSISDFAGNDFQGYQDNRTIYPDELATKKLQFGFTSLNNNNGYPWADYIHFGGYQDASGGNQNLLMLNRNGFGIRQYQAPWQNNNPYANFVDYWNTENFTQNDVDGWKNLVSSYSKSVRHTGQQTSNLVNYIPTENFTANIGFTPYNYQQKLSSDPNSANIHSDMYQGMMISGNDPINVHNFGIFIDQQSQFFVTGGVYDQFAWKKVWTEQHFSQGDLNAWQFNRFNTQPMTFLNSLNNADNITASGFYQIGYGTQNSGADLGINDNVRALLHFETENTYSASQIQTQRYEGNLISRTKADGGWSGWVRHWGNNDFTKSDINNWNSKANSNHSHISLKNEENNSIADTHSLLEDYTFKFVHRINAGLSGSSNMFPTPNNANSIFAVATHPGGYGTLLGFNGDGEIFTKLVSAGNHSPTWRQIAYRDWVLQQIPSLNNYVTLDTEQNIPGRKTFSASAGNGYTGAPVMINGNGSANTVFPTLAFHQPGLYAGTLSYRGNGFYFMNIDGNGFDFVRAAGYIKDGSSNQMLLLGDGSHEDKNKYVFGSNYTGTVEGYSPDKGLPVNSFKPTKSGFYRPNGENEYGSLLMWAEHPQTGNGSYGAGMAFDYAGTNAYLTGIDGAGNKTPNKKLWHSGDFTQAYVTEWINATNAGILTHGSAVQVDGAGGINQGSDSRSNKVWFDYNWAGSGRAGSVINFSGLNPAYNVELFAAYHGDSNAIGIRTRNGDRGVWSLPRWLWNSENFNPDNKVNKSGDTMTGTLSFANNTGGVMGTMGDDDYYRIVGRTNGYDNGYLEIATADGGTEPIHVRQYAGVFTNLVRTATLLDENGNTSFPGTVYSQGFMKTNSDNSMLLLGGGGHKPIADFATVSQLGNFVSKSGDAMAGPLVISTNNDALTVTTSGSVLNAKLYNSSSDSIIRMQSTNNPFWDIRAQADGRFLLENNSVTRLSMDSSANINFSGTSLKFNGHNIWDANNLNPVTLDTPQTIIQEKTFSSGLGLTGGKSIFLKGFSDTAHRVQWFDDDSDGFAVSSAFSVKPYNNLSVSWFTANSGGAYSNGNRIWDTGNLTPVKLDGGKSSVLLNDIGINNLNDLQQTGFFKGSNLINAPLNSPEWFFVISEYHYTGWVSQTATSYGTGSVKAGRTFKRSFTEGTTWTDWNEVITTLTFNPDHYQPIGSYLTTNTTQTIDATKTVGFQNTIYSGWDRSSVVNPQMGPFSLLNLALQGAYPLYGDEEFRNGSNNIGVYNNYGNGTVTMTRETASDLPNRSGVQLRFNYNGNGATPGLGGFILGFNARPNAIFIQKFMAKLPAGYAFNNAENYMGDNASVSWLTSRAGTGKWETYVRAVICGTGTAFGNGGHVYVEGPDTAMEFCLAFAEIYEINSSVFSRIKESFYAKNETVHFNGAISDLITVGDSYTQKKLLSTAWDGTDGDQILLRVPGNQNNGAYLRYSQNGTLNGNIGLLGSDNLTGGQILNPKGDILYMGNHALPSVLLQALTNVHFNYAGAGSIYTFNANGVYLDRNINFNLDNSGFNFYDGGKIYKKAGGGVYINKGNNGLDPRIENADGSQSWAIFHEGNHTPFKNLRGGVVLEEVSESGIYRQEGSTSGFNYTTTLNMNSSDGRQQLTIERSGSGMKFRGSYYGSGNQGWSDWKDVIHSGNITAYLNNYGFITQSALNSQLFGYATLNGVQTFTNTNTFTSSPIIPNGTLGTHAVNKNQIELNAGAEGENGQQLTISGNNSVQLTNFFLTSRDGSRNPNDIAPNATSKRVRFDFAYSTAAGLEGSGNYAGIMTYSPWDGTSASTGDSSYQLAFANQTGVDGAGIPMLKIRKGINGSWTSLWYKFWTEADFSSTNIQQWNHIAQFGLQLNQSFSNTTGYNLMISDDYFGNESGLVDANVKNFVAGRVNEYYKYGSNVNDGLEGINYHLEMQTIGIGGEADKDKVSVEGCVKATENFKSKDERADTLFIPDGRTADLRDEIINDESEYSIRLDPHQYEIDSSGNLEVDDRNRLIHIIGEEVKMSVNFREIYPKQQIVIYNFDQKDYPMAVLIKGKLIYNIEPGAFLRLYVTKSLRVIAERQLPCEFVW